MDRTWLFDSNQLVRENQASVWCELEKADNARPVGRFRSTGGQAPGLRTACMGA